MTGHQDSQPAVAKLPRRPASKFGAMLTKVSAVRGLDLRHLRESYESSPLVIELAKVPREIRRIGRQASKLGHQAIRRSRPTLRRVYAARRRLDFRLIRQNYESSPLAAEPETFCLVRIIGNDLVPRHRKGQSRDNVAFILEHEPELQACSKRWILNRIFDAEEEQAIIEMLKRHGQPYHRIPFDLAAYARQPWDFEGIPEHKQSFDGDHDLLPPEERLTLATRLRRSKSNYAINNNGARNVALTVGRASAKWVLPWDGNCFLTEGAWSRIRNGVARRPFLPYFITPMARVVDNSMLLRARFSPRAREEPQIIFRSDAREMFDERFPYGRRPKVELLWRLGVPGVWDDFTMKEYDLPRPPLCREAGQYARAGWVARLSSGKPTLEVGRKSAKSRNTSRDEAIVSFLDMLDRACEEANLTPRKRGGPGLRFSEELTTAI